MEDFGADAFGTGADRRLRGGLGGDVFVPP